MRKFTLLILFIVFAFSINAFAQTKTIADITDTDLGDFSTDSFKEKVLVGKVVGVHDGDTCTVLDKNKTQYKFRFNGIDAPELRMDFGQKSKKNLSDMIFGKTVTVKYSKKDKYNRYVGNIYINGKDVNLEQIKAGMAWHFKRYADEQSEQDRKEYADAESKAKEAKAGFWSMSNPTAPWDYRATLKTKQANERKTRKYLIGANGGCFYVNSSNRKTYVKKKFCQQ